MLSHHSILHVLNDLFLLKQNKKISSFKSPKIRHSYSGVQISWQRIFLAWNQVNHQNFDQILLTYKHWSTDFHAAEAKKKKNLKKKIQNSRLKKKRSFSSFANFRYFFSKISWIGPFVRRIDWCEGHRDLPKVDF